MIFRYKRIMAQTKSLCYIREALSFRNGIIMKIRHFLVISVELIKLEEQYYAKEN